MNSDSVNGRPILFWLRLRLRATGTRCGCGIVSGMLKTQRPGQVSSSCCGISAPPVTALLWTCRTQMHGLMPSRGSRCRCLPSMTPQPSSIPVRRKVFLRTSCRRGLQCSPRLQPPVIHRKPGPSQSCLHFGGCGRGFFAFSSCPSGASKCLPPSLPSCRPLFSGPRIGCSILWRSLSSRTRPCLALL